MYVWAKGRTFFRNDWNFCTTAFSTWCSSCKYAIYIQTFIHTYIHAGIIGREGQFSIDNNNYTNIYHWEPYNTHIHTCIHTSLYSYKKNWPLSVCGSMRRSTDAMTTRTSPSEWDTRPHTAGSRHSPTPDRKLTEDCIHHAQIQVCIENVYVCFVCMYLFIWTNACMNAYVHVCICVLHVMCRLGREASPIRGFHQPSQSG